MGHLQSSPDLTGEMGCNVAPRSPPCMRFFDNYEVSQPIQLRFNERRSGVIGVPGDRARREGREAPFIPRMILAEDDPWSLCQSLRFARDKVRAGGHLPLVLRRETRWSVAK